MVVVLLVRKGERDIVAVQDKQDREHCHVATGLKPLLASGPCFLLSYFQVPLSVIPLRLCVRVVVRFFLSLSYYLCSPCLSLCLNSGAVFISRSRRDVP